MGRIGKLVVFVIVLLGNVGISSSSLIGAQEFNQAWSCRLDESLMEDTALYCDVAVRKEVSVNGGAFVDANSSVDAVNALVGETVTWRITVEDLSMGGYVPSYLLQIEDVLPAGFSYVSHTVTAGAYTDNLWELPVTDYNFELDTYTGLLPAVLEIRTLAQTAGVWENVATISQMGCDGWCSYIDDESENDRDSAFVAISEKQATPPQVLGSTTTAIPSVSASPQVLAATGGSQAITSVVMGSSLFTAIYVLFRISTRRKDN